MTRPIFAALALLLTSIAVLNAADIGQAFDTADLEQLVTKTHAASLKLRENALRKTIAKDTAWPPGIWGDNLWCLSALYLNEKVDQANARLLKQAKDYITSNPTSAMRTSPENPGNLPWTFFSVTDYVRTLYLFHSKTLAWSKWIALRSAPEALLRCSTGLCPDLRGSRPRTGSKLS